MLLHEIHVFELQVEAIIFNGMILLWELLKDGAY